MLHETLAAAIQADRTRQVRQVDLHAHHLAHLRDHGLLRPPRRWRVRIAPRRRRRAPVARPALT